MDINTLREYLKIHIISLEQDLKDYTENIDNDSVMEINFITGQQVASAHILRLINE